MSNIDSSPDTEAAKKKQVICIHSTDKIFVDYNQPTPLDSS